MAERGRKEKKKRGDRGKKKDPPVFEFCVRI